VRIALLSDEEPPPPLASSVRRSCQHAEVPMNEDTELWQLEERFWLAGAEFYQRRLAPDALMVFPQSAGILDRVATIESVGAATRWQSVTFDEVWCAHPNPDTAALVYAARARRADADCDYLAQCSSIYARGSDGWQLVLHHQTAMAQDK
jgi:hypothetical protein